MNKTHRPRSAKLLLILLMLGATSAAALKLLWQFNPNLLPIAAFAPVDELQCAEIITPNALLSRDRILKLMSLAEGTSKIKVQAVLKSPYCKLQPMTIRAGATAEREVYPLEFDPNIWAIVLYEDDTYAGVRLVPRSYQCSSSSLQRSRRIQS